MHQLAMTSQSCIACGITALDLYQHGERPCARGLWPRSISVPPPPMRGRIIAWSPPPPELPDGLIERDGKIMFVCLGCDRHVELHCDVEEFDPDMAYGGCSPRCLP